MCILPEKTVPEMRYCVGWDVKPYSLTHKVSLQWTLGNHRCVDIGLAFCERSRCMLLFRCITVKLPDWT